MTHAPLLDEAAHPESRLADFFDRIASCTDKGYATHGLHPYPAKFIPHIPRELIRAYSEPGDLVWDPMCGSGTTLVEAAIHGRDSIGGDLNPIAELVSRAKTTRLNPLEEQEVEDLAAELDMAAQISPEGLAAEPPEFTNREHWFEPLVSLELAHAKEMIGWIDSDNARHLALCALSAIIVKVSNQESETRWTAKPQASIPGLTLSRLAERLREAPVRVREFSEEATGSTSVRREDARASSLEDGSVHLIVTSPPYANSHDYYLYNKLRMFWLGYEVRPVQDAEIGSRNRHSDRKEGIDTYLDAMEGVLAEMHRTLVAGGRAVVVVGDAVIRKQFFKMDDLLTIRAQRVGFAHESSFEFDHRRFNSAFQRGFGTRMSKATHVIVLRR